MPQPLVDDDLWAEIEPLLPKKRRRKRNPGRRQLCNRCVLNRYLIRAEVRHSVEMLPKEMGCGSGMTCWRRLKEW